MAERNNREGNSQQRLYYEPSRSYSAYMNNWNPNSDFQRYERKNRNSNNYRPSYRNHDSGYWPQQQRNYDNPDPNNGYPYRRFEKDNYRNQSFEQRRQDDKPVFEYHRHGQPDYQQQTQQQSKLTPEEKYQNKIEDSIFIANEQHKMNQVHGLYQAPLHEIEDPWD
ncbi:hypothetical protein TRFO_06176 [Tritrichomonas foetus]|uniref:Uncharacterized protein n=1 Tax=Tritrichomonas foetus TaxID=1144522 RepID=A0A1J4JZZ8_9EUKA|nr:hypothetical protein TRFO_06176 [Tritrichomonas foetus]|eukprot:OHT04743.1 hypothetical protein TRFO_06176 [Tritrichomonas foetus]